MKDTTETIDMLGGAVRGRPRTHADVAARQRAYRSRQAIARVQASVELESARCVRAELVSQAAERAQRVAELVDVLGVVGGEHEELKQALLAWRIVRDVLADYEARIAAMEGASHAG